MSLHVCVKPQFVNKITKSLCSTFFSSSNATYRSADKQLSKKLPIMSSKLQLILKESENFQHSVNNTSDGPSSNLHDSTNLLLSFGLSGKITTAFSL